MVMLECMQMVLHVRRIEVKNKHQTVAVRSKIVLLEIAMLAFPFISL